MTEQAYVVLPTPGSVRRRVDNPFVHGSEEVAPLPLKSRENTYRQEALEEYAKGTRELAVVYGVVSGSWLRIHDKDEDWVI